MDALQAAQEEPEEPEEATPASPAGNEAKETPTLLPFAVSKEEILKPKTSDKPSILKNVEKYGPKPIAKVNTKDLEEVVRFVVEQQVSIPVLELKKTVSKLLGYARRTPTFDTIIGQVIESLVSRSILHDEAGNLSVNQS